MIHNNHENAKPLLCPKKKESSLLLFILAILIVDYYITKVMKYLFLALRPKQWLKNLFIFLPLIFGKMLFVFPANLESVIAFLLFSMIASVGYLLNDIIDVERDRLHPTKSLRPIASDKISIRQAQLMAFILGSMSIPLSFLLDVKFGWLVIIYFVF